MRGYFGIGIWNGKNKENLGTLWRSAINFKANFIFVIGRRYQKQSSDTEKTWRHIPLFQYETFDHFYRNLPHDCKLIGVEQTERSKDITYYPHPERAVYLLGAEDHGLSPKVLENCIEVIEIPTPRCLNVASVGTIVMYDRYVKNSAKKPENPILGKKTS